MNTHAYHVPAYDDGTQHWRPLGSAGDCGPVFRWSKTSLTMPDEKKPVQPPYRDHSVGRPPLPQTQQVDAAPAWAIRHHEEVMAKQDANHQLVVGEIDGIKRDVTELKRWRDTGKHHPVAMPAEGPQATTSGEVRRISQSDIAQNKAITGLSENQVALSDKVDDLARQMTASTQRLDAQDKEIADVKTVATTTKDNTVDIKKAVGGFMKQHPEIGQAISALIVALIVLATIYVQSKAHP